MHAFDHAFKMWSIRSAQKLFAICCLNCTDPAISGVSAAQKPVFTCVNTENGAAYAPTSWLLSKTVNRC